MISNTAAASMISNNQLFFPAQRSGPTNQLNTELWKTDLTVLGTTVTRDINGAAIFTGQATFPLGSFPQNFTQVGSLLYFTATDSTPGTATGIELWKSDGTTAGTVVARDIVLGSGSSNPANLTNVNGVLFFTASTSTNGTELWRSDAAQGAVLVRDINVFFGGTASSTPANLTNVNGVLYFTADDGTNGVELWRSDGTSGGTVRVETVNRPASWSPQNLTNVNGTLYFTAADNVANGTELFGTSAPGLVEGSAEGDTMGDGEADGEGDTTTTQVWPRGGEDVLKLHMEPLGQVRFCGATTPRPDRATGVTITHSSGLHSAQRKGTAGRQVGDDRES